jgi:ketosteroid isomerase-like protein
MSNSILIRKYFSAYENKDRKAVESLLSDDFVFTSPYDHRINRETYFKRCWPYSEQPPTYEIEKVPERQRSLHSLRMQNQDWRPIQERNSSLSKETR